MAPIETTIHYQHPAAAAAPILSTEEQINNNGPNKLTGLIEQKFMAKDIGYLDDDEEEEPPMHAEDPRDRDIRLRQQLLIDEERKLAATTTKPLSITKKISPAIIPRPSR